jgi:hypothetical protein
MGIYSIYHGQYSYRVILRNTFVKQLFNLILSCDLWATSKTYHESLLTRYMNLRPAILHTYEISSST